MYTTLSVKNPHNAMPFICLCAHLPITSPRDKVDRQKNRCKLVIYGDVNMSVISIHHILYTDVGDKQDKCTSKQV
jgi:hypothetical protein